MTYTVSSRTLNPNIPYHKSINANATRLSVVILTPYGGGLWFNSPKQAPGPGPVVDSGVGRVDPVHLLARCRKR